MTQAVAAHVWRPSPARRVVLEGFAPAPRGGVPAVPVPLAWPAKDPADVLDYEFDVAAALVGDAGDAIASLGVVIAPSAAGDLVLNSVSADGALVLLWLAGGQAGTTYAVQITLTTQSGRTLARSVMLPVVSLSSLSPTTGTASALTTSGGLTITDQHGNPILVGS